MDEGGSELVVAAPTATGSRFRYVRPLADAAERWIEYAANSEGRWMFGLREIDVMTRGFGPGELIYITGFAHSGKTQLLLTGMLNNLDRPFVLFTFDEPEELVLAKLVGGHLMRDGEALEKAIKAKDPATLALVRDVAARKFGNLLVIDEPLSLSDMTVALGEAEAFLGRPVEGVGIDYLELLRSEETEVEKKSQELKRWVKSVNKPVLCMHQGSRGNAGKGQKITMQSMKYGGDAEAKFVLGVRRKRDDGEMLNTHPLWDSVSISVVKNKRPPSKKGEQDFFLDPSCGRIGPLGEVTQPKRTSIAEFVQRAS